jgi:hypothetical protein
MLKLIKFNQCPSARVRLLAFDTLWVNGASISVTASRYIDGEHYGMV